MMSPKLISVCVFSAAMALLMPACVMHRTVTSNGQTIEQGYVVKRPLKDAVNNSQ